MARNGLPTWFENLLPERRSLLRRWICRQHELSQDDSFSLLRVLGHDLPGAVVVEGEPGATARGAETEDSVDNGWRFSLAGVQLKLSMVRQEKGFTLPARSADGDWIVKIPGKEFELLPRVEKLTMEWASLCGLSVPECEIVETRLIDGINANDYAKESFYIRRFDRVSGGRIHQEDLCQALQVSPEDKYGDGNPGVSYDGLAKFVKDVIGEDAQREFVKRLAFIVVSGNGDAHLKNWSVRWPDEGKPVLSPCYDMVTTVTWESRFGWDSPKAPALALALGRERKFAELRKRNLETFVKRGGVDDGVELFRESAKEALAVWPQVASAAPERMVEALKTHWARTPLFMTLGIVP